MYKKVGSDERLTCKARTVDVLHAMVGHKELLLPPHEHSSPIGVFHGQMGFLEFVADLAKSWETTPVDHVFLLRCAPAPGEEAIAAADDLCVKEGGELGPVVGESADAEVTAEVGRRKVDVLRQGKRIEYGSLGQAGDGH